MNARNFFLYCIYSQNVSCPIFQFCEKPGNLSINIYTFLIPMNYFLSSSQSPLKQSALHMKNNLKETEDKWQ